jgi:hypothetical protein
MILRHRVNLICTCEIRGSHDGIPENPCLLGCDAVSMCNVWNDHSTFIFRVHQFKQKILKMKAVRSFETSITTCPTTLES